MRLPKLPVPVVRPLPLRRLLGQTQSRDRPIRQSTPRQTTTDRLELLGQAGGAGTLVPRRDLLSNTLLPKIRKISRTESTGVLKSYGFCFSGWVY